VCVCVFLQHICVVIVGVCAERASAGVCVCVCVCVCVVLVCVLVYICVFLQHICVVIGGVCAERASAGHDEGAMVFGAAVPRALCFCRY
jgi:hypothetical protein